MNTKRRRKTLAQVRADAAENARTDAIAEVCRVLKYEFNMADVADDLWVRMGYRHLASAVEPIGLRALDMQ